MKPYKSRWFIRCSGCNVYNKWALGFAARRAAVKQCADKRAMLTCSLSKPCGPPLRYDLVPEVKK